MKRNVKVKLNIVGIILAIIVAGLFFVMNFMLGDNSKNNIGTYFIKAYEYIIYDRANSAISSLEKGDTGEVFSLLSDWENIQKLDRGYPAKRDLYVALSKHLHAKQKFERLMTLSRSWRAIDDRDVTAMAYFFEALRHISGREEEGDLGLINQFKRFPSNYALRKFLKDSAISGNLESARLLDTIKPSISGWKVFWFKDKDFSGQGMELSLDAKNEKGDYYNISVDVPGNTAIFRLDLPLGEPIGLMDVGLKVNGQFYSIPSDKISLIRMSRDGEWFVAPGGQVSFVYFNSEYIFKNIVDKQVNVILRFRMKYD